jgi:hypothetical protein
MDWSSFWVLVLFGAIGAWIGMHLSRRLKRRKKPPRDEQNPLSNDRFYIDDETR